MSINLATYPVLNTYVVLAGAQITNSGSTTVTNGKLGSPGGADPGGITYVNGSLDNTANATTAQTQLTALVNAIAAISTTATISAPTVASGQTLTFTAGKYTTAGTLTLQAGGTIVFDAQNVSTAQFYIVAATGVVFTAGTVSLVNGAQAGNIFIVSGALISNALAGMSLFGVLIAQSGITLNTGSSVLGRMFAQTAAITLLGNSITLASTSVVCFLEGTQILTKSGYKSIQNIKAGESIAVKGKINGNQRYDVNAPLSLEEVKWIGRFKVYETNSETLPICFKKDSLCRNVPNRDLFVSPNHGILVDGHIHLAKSFVNDSTITQSSDMDTIYYYHIEMAHHSAIIANGVMTESYLDCKNRNEFKETAVKQVKMKTAKKSLVHVVYF
jgi:hypothetical protein